jgi:hypothetical protein
VVLRFISMTKSGEIGNSARREFTLIGICGRPGAEGRLVMAHQIDLFLCASAGRHRVA